jgi:hypothetical protein
MHFVIMAGQPTLEAGEQDAEQALARLAKLGVDLGAITQKNCLPMASPPSPILWTSSWPR